MRLVERFMRSLLQMRLPLIECDGNIFRVLGRYRIRLKKGKWKREVSLRGCEWRKKSRMFHRPEPRRKYTWRFCEGLGRLSTFFRIHGRMKGRLPLPSALIQTWL